MESMMRVLLLNKTLVDLIMYNDEIYSGVIVYVSPDAIQFKDAEPDQNGEYIFRILRMEYIERISYKAIVI